MSLRLYPPFPSFAWRNGGDRRAQQMAFRQPVRCDRSAQRVGQAWAAWQEAVFARRLADGENKARGVRRKGAAEPSAPGPAPSRASHTWAIIIKRDVEVNPLACPECGGQRNVIAFIEPWPPERSDGRPT